MTIKAASLKIDTAAERDGEWVEIDSWFNLDPSALNTMVPTPGLAFRVRSLNAPNYKTARQKWLESIEEKRKADPDSVTDDFVEQGNAKLINDELLLEWRGLDVEYSPENAQDLILPAEGRVFRDMIMFAASKVGRRKIEFIKDGEKNSD